MTPTTAAVLGGLVGLLIALVAVGFWRASRRSRAEEQQAAYDRAALAATADVLSVLRSSGIIVDDTDAVISHSPSAEAYGLVRHDELVHDELIEMVDQVRRDGVIRESELDLSRPPMRQSSMSVRARVAPLRTGHILLLIEDNTQARRVEEIRRDFVANVSHELKTPVGGLALLAEAVLDARDDPEAVQRFASRMLIETDRLTRLVKEIVDLSRLQAAQSLTDPQRVSIRSVVDEAIDLTKVAADAKDITVAARVPEQLSVFGDHDLLVTAVGNLIGNAIAYSSERTKVGVGARQVNDVIEISVTDQGPGIAQPEQSRIFERFYRVDAARSRATGGTGLGLSIVKHICANHGGDVQVWSEEGHGSTFTIRLPAATAPHATVSTAQGDRES